MGDSRAVHDATCQVAVAASSSTLSSSSSSTQPPPRISPRASPTLLAQPLRLPALPWEIWAMILRELDGRELARLSTVSRHFFRLTNDDPTVWQRRCLVDYGEEPVWAVLAQANAEAVRVLQQRERQRIVDHQRVVQRPRPAVDGVRGDVRGSMRGGGVTVATATSAPIAIADRTSAAHRQQRSRDVHMTDDADSSDPDSSDSDTNTFLQSPLPPLRTGDIALFQPNTWKRVYIQLYYNREGLHVHDGGTRCAARDAAREELAQRQRDALVQEAIEFVLRNGGTTRRATTTTVTPFGDSRMGMRARSKSDPLALRDDSDDEDGDGRTAGVRLDVSHPFSGFSWAGRQRPQHHVHQWHQHAATTATAATTPQHQLIQHYMLRSAGGNSVPTPSYLLDMLATSSSPRRRPTTLPRHGATSSTSTTAHFIARPRITSLTSGNVSYDFFNDTIVSPPPHLDHDNAMVVQDAATHTMFQQSPVSIGGASLGGSLGGSHGGRSPLREQHQQQQMATFGGRARVSGATTVVEGFTVLSTTNNYAGVGHELPPSPATSWTLGAWRGDTEGE